MVSVRFTNTVIRKYILYTNLDYLQIYKENMQVFESILTMYDDHDSLANGRRNAI